MTGLRSLALAGLGAIGLYIVFMQLLWPDGWIGFMIGAGLATIEARWARKGAEHANEANEAQQEG